MIFGDAGSSWCKVFDTRDDAVRIVPASAVSRSAMNFDWGTGHSARNRSIVFENDLISLCRGALFLVDDDDFTVLDLGSRDAKMVVFKGRRPVKLDWSVGCAAATGATLEMIGRFYEVDFESLEMDGEWTPVTCGTYAVERIMDAVSGGTPVERAVAGFVHGLARNAFSFAQEPGRLHLSGGFTMNQAFLDALGRYTEVVPMGRTLPLAGLWAFACDRGEASGPIPEPLSRSICLKR